MTNKEQKTKSGFFRSLSLAVIIGIAGGILISGNVLFWVGDTIVSDQQFTKTTAPLIKNPAIQTAVAKYGTDQLFSNIDVQGYVSNVLPPKASFLAPSLTTQLKKYVNIGLQKTLEKPKVQNIWNNSLQKTHNAIIKGATNYKGDGKIDLGQLFTFMTNNLKNTKLGFLAGKSLPANIGQIQLVDAKWLPVVHNIVVNVKPFEAIMTLAFAILVCLSIIIAKNKNRIIVKMGFLFSFLMLLTIISLRIIRMGIEGRVSADYQNAAVSAYQIVMKPFYIQTATLLILFLAVTFIAFLTGNSKSAIKFKKSVSTIISGNIHKLIFKNKENKLTNFIAKHKKYIIWSIIIIISGILCFITLSLATILAYLIVALVLILVVDILSANK
ncbi:MAG: hypothetical protein WCI60_01400 [bacterium]